MRFELKIATPLREQADDLWSQLLALAESAEPETRKKFLTALMKLQDGIDVNAIADALARGDVNAIIDAIPWDDLQAALKEIESSLEHVRARAFELSRGAAEPHLDPTQLAIHLGERSTMTVGWRHVSAHVLDAIRARTGDRITQVTDETRAAVRQLVERTYTEGGHARTMIPAIRESIGLTTRQERAVARYQASLQDGKRPTDRVERMVTRYRKKLIKNRAELIARTETLQAMNDGQRSAWSTLVERGLLDPNKFEREWLAIVPSDGRTCPICRDLDGARAPIGGTYADGSLGPPEHPDCFLPGTLVAASGRIAAHMKRWFEGEIVRVRIETGHEIAVTPNHPILTLRGWVPARELNELDHVIQAIDPNATVFALDPNQCHMEAVIEEVPRPLWMASGVASVIVPLSAENIHGDGAGSTEVHIVRADGLLRSEFDAMAPELALNGELCLAHADFRSLNGDCAFHAFAEASFSPTNGRVGRFGSSEPLFDRCVRGPGTIPLASRSNRQPSADERATNALRAVPEFLGDAHTRLAGHVQAVHVTEIVRGNRWQGHVYNLETEGGWYIANTVLVHNCRCTESVVPIKAAVDKEPLATVG